MPLSKIDGDLYVSGSVVSQSMTLPSASVTNASVAAAAGIDTTKLDHLHVINLALGSHTDDAATVRKAMHRVYGATATVTQFGVYVTVAAGAATTLTVDLLKNGSSILSATFTVDNGDAAYALVEPAGFSSTSLVEGDVLEVSIVLAGTNEPKGVNAFLVIDEAGL